MSHQSRNKLNVRHMASFTQTQIKIPRCGRAPSKAEQRRGGKNARFARSLTRYVRKRNGQRNGRERGRIKGREDKRSGSPCSKTHACTIVRRSWRPAGIFVSDVKRPRARVPVISGWRFPSQPVPGRICFIPRGNVADRPRRSGLRLARASRGSLSTSRLDSRKGKTTRWS